MFHIRKCPKMTWPKNFQFRETILYFDFCKHLRSPHVKNKAPNLFREHSEYAAPVISFLANPPQMAILQ